MKTSKIAIAVFLGVMAALLVYHFPGWWQKHAADKQAEKELDIELRLRELTPPEVLAQCGRPKEDERFDESPPYQRYLTYESPFGAIQLQFSGQNRLQLVLLTYSGPILDWSQLTDMLPCLTKATEEADRESDTQLTLEGLTSEEVLAQCGKPKKDKWYPDPGERILTYESTDKRYGLVQLGFSDPDGVFQSSPKEEPGLKLYGFDSTVWPPFGWNELPNMLPCLKGQLEGKQP